MRAGKLLLQITAYYLVIALAVFIALGVYAAVVLAWPLLRVGRWLFVGLSAMTILLAVAQTVFYFRDQVPNFNGQLQQEDWNDAFLRMVDLPSGTHVHFVMNEPVWGFNINAFLQYYRLNLDVDALMPKEVDALYLRKLKAETTGQQVFFINPSQKAVLLRLSRYFTLESPQFNFSDVATAYQLWLYKVRVDQTQ